MPTARSARFEPPVRGRVPWAPAVTTAVDPTVVVVTCSTPTRVVDVGAIVVVVACVVVVAGAVVVVVVVVVAVVVVVEVDVVLVEVVVDVDVDVVVAGTVDVVVVEAVVVVAGTVDVVVMAPVVVVVAGTVDVVVVAPVVVVVTGRVDVVVVAAIASGSCRVRKTWSVVATLLLDETRSWQFVKLWRPFCGSASRGDKQLNNCCGLAPLNGLNS